MTTASLDWLGKGLIDKNVSIIVMMSISRGSRSGRFTVGLSHMERIEDLSTKTDFDLPFFLILRMNSGFGDADQLISCYICLKLLKRNPKPNDD